MRKILIKSILQTIPAVIIGGILSIVSIYAHNNFFKIISNYSFMMVPAFLGGFIAKEKAGSIAFIPGMIVGSFCQYLQLGIFGGIIGGVFIGYFIEFLKNLKIPLEFASGMYLVIIPIASTLLGSLFIFFIVNVPLHYLVNSTNSFLNNLSEKNIIFLAFILCGMIGVDLGGPINKLAYIYGITTLEFGRYDIMGAICVAICIPPLALGLAQFILKNHFSKMEKDVGLLAIFLGVIGITEGALLYLTKDIKILPVTAISSAIGGCAAIILHVNSSAPHGGLIVLPLVSNKLGFIFAVIVGVFSAIFLLYFLKTPVKEKEE